MTPARKAELRALEAALPWKGPWTAHTFEIDCPCPNGEHCGGTHTCEEVEAREEYPNGAPGEPAPAGRGQCVVQIDVPGLETFAKPCAAFIAAARQAVPELLSALDAETARADADANFVKWLTGELVAIAEAAGLTAKATAPEVAAAVKALVIDRDAWRAQHENAVACWREESARHLERNSELARRADAAERLCVALADWAGYGPHTAKPVPELLPADWREQVEAMRRRMGT